MGFKTIKKLTPPLKTKPYFLMLSHQFVKKHPIVAEEIWDMVEQVREQITTNVANKYLK